MKNSNHLDAKMQKALHLFKNLFQPFTNISILHAYHENDFLQSTLQEVASSLEGQVHTLHCSDESSLRLKHGAREFEYIILHDVLFLCEYQEKILRMMYKALENSANIIILEHYTHYNQDALQTLLDKVGFVAINSIELFDEYALITAKKLHMWGNGQ